MNSDCLFCRENLQKIYNGKYFFAIYDQYPVREGHILIIPVRHTEHLLHLTRGEWIDLYDVIQAMVTHIKIYFDVDGYNIGVNCGEVAGQTISHLHIHIIPRYPGDVPNPRGGIRNFLPNPLKEYPSASDE